MMNKEMMGRLKTAAGYQKKAIRALLPEGMEGHLDVIEKEVKMMVAEAAAGFFTGCMSSTEKKDEPQDRPDKGSRKVTIE
jgi:hypothetical protein